MNSILFLLNISVSIDIFLKKFYNNSVTVCDWMFVTELF